MTCCSCMCRCGVVTAVAGLPHTTTINRSVECVLGKKEAQSAKGHLRARADEHGAVSGKVNSQPTTLLHARKRSDGAPGGGDPRDKLPRYGRYKV